MSTPGLLAKYFSLDSCAEPFLIAGPCGAESEAQVYDTAKSLFSQGVRVLRAGVWKPRTRADSFSGVGTPALHWLNRVQSEIGMRVVTEVATAQHVQEALAAGVDGLWIGARTTVNTFAVQEIALALQGIDIPVMVKNPINPDLELWLGAVERIRRSGIKKIVAIHRGFYKSSASIYRNDPQWQLAIDFRLREPALPILCDPSHMAGRRELLLELSQRALDLSYDGLMIEVHRDPQSALSDAEQQLSPIEFSTLIAQLVLRREEESNDRVQRDLAHLRGDIDRIDDELIHLLAQRMRISETIGMLKKELGVTILQSSRWDKLLARVTSQGRSRGLSEICVENIFKEIHEDSMNRQNRVMNCF